MTPTKRPRGRPPGSGIDDMPALIQVADLLVGDPSLTPTTAMKRVMRSRTNWGAIDATLLRRWQDKWKHQGAALRVAAQERARPKPTMAESIIEARRALAEWSKALKDASEIPALAEWSKALKDASEIPAIKKWDEHVRLLQQTVPRMCVSDEMRQALRGFQPFRVSDEVRQALQGFQQQQREFRELAESVRMWRAQSHFFP
jgi:hypothetical protein